MQKIYIAGASVRAAAQSAVAADFQPLAADLFADADLAAICPRSWPAVKVEHYPGDFVAQAARAKAQGATAWMYTGALENHPHIVEQISAGLPLWGNSADLLRQVRSPNQFFDALSTAGFHVPKIAWRMNELDPQMRWLKKPVRSAGGIRIEPVDFAQELPETIASGGDSDSFYQQWLPGESHSAAYVAAKGKSALLGIARQLIGTDWLGSHGYHYAGSIGPLCRSPRVEEQFARLGEFLAAHFPLTGLFGVDAIVNYDRVWPVEINPRYTASMELTERARGVSLVALHAAACQHGSLPASLTSSGTLRGQVFGKGIVFAKKQMLVSAAQSAMLLAAAQGASAWLADIPVAGTAIEAGQPIATIFAAGDDEATIEAQLRRAAHQLTADWD